MILPVSTAILETIATTAYQLLVALASVLIAEVVRDLYHLAGHYWQPLQVGHALHHKAYRRDLSIVSLEAYRTAQWHNDVPESTVMVAIASIIALAGGNYANYALWVGCLYALLFWITSVARSQGLLLGTDLTHKPGDLVVPPSRWVVNRTYHWRHHFDQGNAYFCGTFTLVDKILGTCLSLKGKTIAVTGASGSLGRSLIAELARKGAKVVALTTSTQADFETGFEGGVEVMQWQVGQESELRDQLQKIDILVINHGTNVHRGRSPQAIQQSFEVNAFSAWRWMELFLETVTSSRDRAIKEVWINTSEAEVNPAFSPLYEMSKRALGNLITLRRLDAPCTIRKLILGPFKSNLNPIGIMSPDWVAWAIVGLAQRDVRNIIVTVNPITYLIFLPSEWLRSLYFQLCTTTSTISKESERV